MSELIRFGVSLEKELVDKFDTFIKEHNYNTRSKAIGDLIRESLVKQEWASGNDDVAGAVILVYDHHKRELLNNLMNIQHDFHHMIVSSQHIHLDHDNCLEVVVVKGKAEKVDELTRLLKALKGVKHVSLSMTTTGEGIV